MFEGRSVKDAGRCRCRCRCSNLCSMFELWIKVVSYRFVINKIEIEKEWPSGNYLYDLNLRHMV